MKILLTGQCTLHWGRMEYGNIGNYYIFEPLLAYLNEKFEGKTSKIPTLNTLKSKLCIKECGKIVNEETETEIDEKEKLDSNNETSSEIDPTMQKYSDFISFSKNYEKQGFYTNHFSELKKQ